MHKGKEEREKGFQSLSVRIMRGISIPVVAVFLIAAVLILMMVRASVDQMSETELTVKSQSASYQVSEFFTSYLSEAQQIAANRTYESFILETGTKRMEDMPDCDKIMSYLLKSAKTDEENILSVWIGNFANSQIMQSDGFFAKEGWDITGRPWYVVKETGDVFLTSPYVDASTGQMIITAAAPVTDEETGEIVGAAGIDIALGKISDIMGQYTLGEAGSFVLTDPDSQIIYCSDESKIQKNISEMGLSDNIVNAIDKNENEFMKYKMDGTNYYGYVSSLSTINWSVTSMLPASEFNAAVIRLAIFVAALFAVGILIVVLMVRGITSSVVKPLKVLTKTAEEIARGNLDVEVNVASKDEIGKLGSAITDTVSRLKQYIKYITEISDVLGKIAEGNLMFQLRESYTGEFAVLKEGLLQIQHKLTGTITNMSQIAEQVEEGAKQISQVASSLAESSGEQNDSVERLNQTVGRVNQMADETQKNAGNAKDSSNLASEHLSQGNDKMKELTWNIRQINESSQKIGGIMAIIDEISEQTNLLSLNASIEAARAGEAGKGFAVVANEVGALAKQTAESAKETRDLITDVLEQIAQGERVADDAAEMMLEVMERARAATGSMEEITQAVGEETEAILTLKHETEQITAGVESNMAISQESVASSEELAAQATVLRELVEEFKI